MEQFVAELETLVGERTQRERTELLTLNEVELNRLIKYARLAAFRAGKQMYESQAMPVAVVSQLTPDKEVVEKPASKRKK